MLKLLDGSAFVGVNIDSILIESGNKIFEVMNGFLIEVEPQKLIRNFTRLSNILIPHSFPVPGLFASQSSQCSQTQQQ
jgi:hypothetical protein